MSRPNPPHQRPPRRFSLLTRQYFFWPDFSLISWIFGKYFMLTFNVLQKIIPVSEEQGKLAA